jgi:hypothetical protein
MRDLLPRDEAERRNRGAEKILRKQQAAAAGEGQSHEVRRSGVQSERRDSYRRKKSIS